MVTKRDFLEMEASLWLKMGDPKMLLKVDCLPNAVGKQPSIPLIDLGRNWTGNWTDEDDDDETMKPRYAGRARIARYGCFENIGTLERSVLPRIRPHLAESAIWVHFNPPIVPDTLPRWLCCRYWMTCMLLSIEKSQPYWWVSIFQQPSTWCITSFLSTACGTNSRSMVQQFIGYAHILISGGTESVR